jgi:hypothetical protein
VVSRVRRLARPVVRGVAPEPQQLEIEELLGRPERR